MAEIEKKILLAVDGSLHSRIMLDYVLRMRRYFPGLKCCLFHVQRDLPLLLVEEAEHDPEAKAQLKAISRRNADHARRVLDDGREMLQRGGMAADAIEAISQPRSLGVARDIIIRAETGRFDAIVVGRRGLTGLQQLFIGSLTAKLCEHTEIVPVWVVDGECRNDGFLVAVDGSANSLRAVDHLAFMVSGVPSVPITLLHVIPRFSDHCEIDFEDTAGQAAAVLTRSDQRCLDRFAAKAVDRLKEAGLDSGSIDFKQVNRATGIGRAILEIARRQGLGTVVVGRRGSGGAFYHGRVCRYVMEKSAARTFWLVP
ncbi:MAG: universal stress protein [Desulfobacterales bacterium]|jgi:nucleotide-binding universal stress UspA family protein|nr:universal stress protein [Desulfobacteraceae bacterium]MDD3992105.1 universal stress protein [Desulfobacteraceae bacterium]MDY0312251.1 universal stress protein [Desulfobacterales bacterium]